MSVSQNDTYFNAELDRMRNRRYIAPKGQCHRGDIEDLVRILHERAQATGLDGVLCLTVIRAIGEDEETKNYLFKIGDIDGMTDAAFDFGSQLDVKAVSLVWAILPHELGFNRRGTQEQVLAVLALVLDGDADKGITINLPEDLSPSFRLLTSDERYEEVITDGQYEARIIHGPNSHWYFIFDEAIRSWEEAQSLAEKLYIAAGGRSDTATKIIHHPWRCAGTLNRKRDEPFLTRIDCMCEGDPTRAYPKTNLETFRQILSNILDQAPRVPTRHRRWPVNMKSTVVSILADISIQTANSTPATIGTNSAWPASFNGASPALLFGGRALGD